MQQKFLSNGRKYYEKYKSEQKKKIKKSPQCCQITKFQGLKSYLTNMFCMSKKHVDYLPCPYKPPIQNAFCTYKNICQQISKFLLEKKKKKKEFAAHFTTN